MTRVDVGLQILGAGHSHVCKMADWDLRVSGLGALCVLPDHVLNMIMLNLPIPDVVSLSSASRALRVVCCEEPLWQQLCLRLPVDHEKMAFLANWRQTALQLVAKHPEACAYEEEASLASPQPAKPLKLRIPPDSSIQAAANPPAPVPLQSEFLYKRWYRCHTKLSGFLPEQQLVPRVSITDMTAQDFMAAYDATCLPVVLTNAMDDWPKDHDWSFPGLAKAYSNSVFHISMPGGASSSCSMTMGNYWDYVQRQADEEPLYVFDPGFAFAAPALLQSYKIPAVFNQDYFSVLEPEWRPQFQWVVAGPARSGASWHIDPKLTSAWNALCSGRKRWALYPPHVPPPCVHLVESEPGSLSPDDSFTSLQWYLEVYPTLAPEQKPIEFIQEPGDVVFVPGGWWHMVLNLEDSVAVTQNFVSDANLERVVAYMGNGSFHYYHNMDHYYTPAQMASWDAIKPYKILGIHEDTCSDDEGSESWEEVGQDGTSSPPAQSQPNVPPASVSSETDSSLDEDLPLTDDQYDQLGIWPSDLVGGKIGTESDSVVRPDPDQGESVTSGSSLKCMHARVDLAAASAGAGSTQAGSLCSDSLRRGMVNGDGEPGLAHEVCEPTPWTASKGLPVPPMQRDRLLGRWLRELLLQQPQLAPAVRHVATKHVGLGYWVAVLSAIKAATAHHVAGDSPQPAQPTAIASATTVTPLDDGDPTQAASALIQQLAIKDKHSAQHCTGSEMHTTELLPYVGSGSMVFLQSDGTAVKLILEQPKSIAGLMCVSEVHVPHMLRLTPSHLSPSIATAAPFHPAVHAHGVLEVSYPRAQASSTTTTATTADVAATTTAKENGQSQLGPTDSTDSTRGTSLFPFVCVQSVGFQDNWQALVKTWPDLPRWSKVSAAQGLGRMMAALHVRGHIAAEEHVQRASATPPAIPDTDAATPAIPDTDATQEVVIDWQAVLSKGQTWWHDRVGNAWTSHQGHVVKSDLVGPHEQPAGVPRPPPSSPYWAPFVEFLRTRRGEARMALKYVAELPEWLLQQVDVFLPCDPLVLVEHNSSSSSGEGGPGSNPVPVLLHGDVTLNNVLYTRASTSTTPGLTHQDQSVSPQDLPHSTDNGSPGSAGTAAVPEEAAVRSADVQGSEATASSQDKPRTRFLLLDWADAGFGDPLYDIVALNASIFLHDPELLSCFWAAYKQQLVVEAGELRVPGDGSWAVGGSRAAAAARLAQCGTASEALQVMWPARGADGQTGKAMPLSKVAMCYSLLYEEPDMVSKMWARHGAAAQGGQADGTSLGVLGQLASVVFGALDAV